MTENVPPAAVAAAVAAALATVVETTAGVATVAETTAEVVTVVIQHVEILTPKYAQSMRSTARAATAMCVGFAQKPVSFAEL